MRVDRVEMFRKTCPVLGVLNTSARCHPWGSHLYLVKLGREGKV